MDKSKEWFWVQERSGLTMIEEEMIKKLNVEKEIKGADLLSHVRKVFPHVGIKDLERVYARLVEGDFPLLDVDDWRWPAFTNEWIGLTKWGSYYKRRGYEWYWLFPSFLLIDREMKWQGLMIEQVGMDPKEISDWLRGVRRDLPVDTHYKWESVRDVGGIYVGKWMPQIEVDVFMSVWKVKGVPPGWDKGKWMEKYGMDQEGEWFVGKERDLYKSKDKIRERLEEWGLKTEKYVGYLVYTDQGTSLVDKEYWLRKWLNGLDESDVEWIRELTDEWERVTCCEKAEECWIEEEKRWLGFEHGEVFWSGSPRENGFWVEGQEIILITEKAHVKTEQSNVMEQVKKLKERGVRIYGIYPQHEPFNEKRCLFIDDQGGVKVVAENRLYSSSEIVKSTLMKEDQQIFKIWDGVDEEDWLLTLTKQGYVKIVAVEGFKPKHRASKYVRGTRMEDGDELVYACVLKRDAERVKLRVENKLEKKTLDCTVEELVYSKLHRGRRIKLWSEVEEVELLSRESMKKRKNGDMEVDSYGKDNGSSKE